MVLDWWMKQQGKPGTPQNENENETETDPTRTDAKTQSNRLSSIKHMVLRKQEEDIGLKVEAGTRGPLLQSATRASIGAYII